MSFIQKSANYSQICKVKNDIVIPKLVKYNNVMTNKQKEMDFIPNDTPFKIFPNNNKKYYVYITHKQLIDHSKEAYNILYFFPDQDSVAFYKANKVVQHSLSDFFVEINKRFDKEILLEGYVYIKDNVRHFLCTDILMINDDVVTLDHDTRWAFLHEYIFFNKYGSLQQLNHHITFEMHPYVLSSNLGLLMVFKENFEHKQELVCQEHVFDNKKQRQIPSQFLETKEPCQKKIKKTQMADVYQVYSMNMNNEEGILYVQGLVDSQYLKHKFNSCTSDHIVLDCVFDQTRNKWKPITS